MTNIYGDEQSVAADAAFGTFAANAFDDLLRRQPVLASALGDHRFDGVMPDLSESGQAELRAVLERRLTELDAVDDTVLSQPAILDLETLRSALASAAFDVTVLRRNEWDPLVWNPGDALWQLMSRDVLEPSDRIRALTGRLQQIPEWLETGRRTLGNMPRVHAETAIAQLGGTDHLLMGGVEELAQQDKALGRQLQQARDGARRAVSTHRAWLANKLAAANGVNRDPRFGEQMYAATLWYVLDGGPDPQELYKIATQSLADTRQALVEVAAMLLNEPEDTPGLVDRAIEFLATSGPVTSDTVLQVARAALETAAHFTRENDIVTVLDDPVYVVEMPEIHRGVAVAYCDAPGALEPKRLPTLFSVAPAPESWPYERKVAFYREYNAHMLHSLAIHEGIPGHALQLAHSRRAVGPTRLRQAVRSGPFVEGWAVYVEEVLATNGYPGVPILNGDIALQFTWLKTRLRSIANTLLDIGVHSMNMSEAEGMDLLVRQAFQDPHEAVSKWRRSLLTAGQLSTYFVGYLGVRSVVEDLRCMHPNWTNKQLHDTILEFGSPSPRVLRIALGLPELMS